MTRGEEHPHNILTPFDDCFGVDSFCVSWVNQFPVSISRNLIFSVSLELHQIQLFELAYKLAD